jgi:hypothetical protein
MRDRSPAQNLAIVFGLAFLGTGILGFIPADDLLHLALAVGLLGSWWVAARARPRTTVSPA